MNNLWQYWVELNQKYDRLPEPRRCLTFMIPVGTFIGAIHYLMAAYPYPEYPLQPVFTIMLLVVMGLLGVARLYYMKNSASNKTATKK